MSNEEYIFKKLENLSPADKILSEKIEKSLGKEWVTPKEVAEYLGRHINTIYEKINNEEILSRKIGVRRMIFTPSIILIME
ncbi:helix-turn-helix domain-containing protein [Fusobacterium mortiferum]|uniref:Helix-turn-helix domain-containing protein n=1 Tax=Fusobacterium mortiferum TaxID=850 RepID=A0ABS2G1F5_FUSMR|nr:helix-turn-helix domain-containing protein [Fusobacterium mortiferum]MBM6690468.1 helix-turn-helix domain-containing protein [Fusobacterium mortiferum]MBM6874467.1 helix-turn-helix domain-containing protein [Fusobacterium mortiferum]